MELLEALKTRRLYLDGAMGTQLFEKGLPSGEMPETWNILHPESVAEVHRSYLNAGSDIISTNTFGANSLKCENLEDIITSAVRIADKERKAAEAETGEKKYIALDIGPLGKLLKPFGDLEFEDAVSVFAKTVKIGAECGVDLIFLETFTDLYELKAAIIAASENSDLPIFASCAFDETHRLMTGADAAAVVAMCEGLGVSAVGANCGVGPDQLLPIVDDFCKYSSLPIIVKPNAGLPHDEHGMTVFDLSSDAFTEKLISVLKDKGSLIGGCCGTTPDHIRSLIKAVKKLPYTPQTKKGYTMISSYSHACIIGEKPVLVGERINPTGKKAFREALKSHDMAYIINQANLQQKAGAEVLDINVGIPEADENELMQKAVTSVQSVVDLPLQIDSSDPQVIDNALRIVCGKALVNSVNGKIETMEKIFPSVKKYGGVVVGLTLDENGIPNTPEERFAIAERIVNTALSHGIEKKNIIIDPLTLTVATDKDSANVTLQAMRMIREKLGVGCCLGVSNISFGLPDRERLNASFFTLALGAGLNCAIMNPLSEKMMNAYYDYLALSGHDVGCIKYIDSTSVTDVSQKQAVVSNISLREAVISGLKEEAAISAKALLAKNDAMFIINSILVPALSEVGDKYAEKTLFLPQLLMSAEAASAAFEVIRNSYSDNSNGAAKKEKVILATVKGDIHDIGKNIVRSLLENYNYDVIDLGRDVAPELIVKTALSENVKLVGLSALMTTTLPSMAVTVKQIKLADPDIKVMVGGAVLTQEYADMIGADHYSPDAMSGVRYAEKLFNH